MDKTSTANLDAQLRQCALGHATHDCRGNEAPDIVVTRAQAYYEFLKGALQAEAS
jgi:hypothetical protein